MQKNTYLFVLLFLFSGISLQAQWTNGQAADLVLGQPNLTSNTANNGGVNASALDRPSGTAIDLVNNKMYVVDRGNHRVLRYSYPITSNQQAAEAVLGQPNFTSSGPATTQSRMSLPTGITIDNSGTLWVVDTNNHRVLRFDNASSKANGANADGVLGQTNFTSSVQATTQSRMRTPVDVVIDNSGTLWVVDQNNRRVLRFDNASSKANGANADGVLGQANFTSIVSATTQSGMGRPRAAAIDNSGTLWVTDESNNRVLRFDNAPSKANGANADGVLGQINFTSSGFGTTQSSMRTPMGLALDGNGRLYVAEANNNRVLLFDNASSKANGANADNVLGQPNFTSSGAGNTASSMNIAFRSSIAVDNINNLLWVSDTNNNRVLRFTPTSPIIPPVPIPALSEWGVFLMFLTMMCLGMIAFYNVERRRQQQLATTAGSISMSSNLFLPFDRSGFMDALKMALLLVPMGFALIWIGWGEIIVDDFIGMTFAVPIVAYLIYLLKWKE